jgi:hypothetical protein
MVNIVTACFYFTDNDNSKFGLLMGGLAASLFVAIIQFLFAWNEHLEIEAIKRLGVKRVLPHRDEEAFYRGLIKAAKNRICVMGVTGVRFMRDFADSESGRSEKRVLIDALKNNVEVQILMPSIKHLKSGERDMAKILKNLFSRVKKISQKFSVRYFDHIPTHSIVIVDDLCLLGPVFPDVASKDTPCILISANSIYANPYTKYFDSEWNNAAIY